MSNRTLYIFGAIIIVGVMAFSFSYYAFIHGPATTGETTSTANSDVLGSDGTSSGFADAAKPIYEKPETLIIDSVNINVVLVEVGVEEDGNMEAPEDYYVGGWYKFGAKPGEPGNLIIDGHYDTPFGGAAAFWELKNVKVDDTVLVIDSLGRDHTYRILEKFYLDINDPDKLKIFESPDDKYSLTLITCGGIYLTSESTYSQRLVVKGELIR
jgi:LPXTG-site transpeptidase (sortase) family protein